MNAIWRLTLGVAALSTSLAISDVKPVQAGPIDWLLQSKTFPDCHDPKVLGKIKKRFNWAEDATWNRGFYLDHIERTRERVVHDAHVSSIPRRYCRAHARLSNGKHPTLYYLIEAGQGFAGNSFNVEFCISGLDRWNEYDGSCRVLRY